MRTILVALALSVLSLPASAYDVSCSITNLNATQQQWADAFVTLQNSQLPSGDTPYTDISDYCARTIKDSTAKSWLDQMRQLMSDALGQAALDHGEETASAGQCSAAGLESGCLLYEVACFVLTGDAAACEP